MSRIDFVVRDGQETGARPNDSVASFTFDPTEISIMVPTPRASEVIAMDGKSGTTRVRGYTREGRLTISQLPSSAVPVLIDFAHSMMFGYQNPFTLLATDCYNIQTDMTCVVPAGTVIEPVQLGCGYVSLSFPYRRVA